MTATTDNRELRDRHIAVLEGLLADAGEPDLRMSTDEKDAIRAAIALMRGQSEDAPSIECYSYDGDQWFDSPDDIEFVAGRRAGDRFTLMVSHYSINRDYVVTKAPDKFGDDYEVEPAPPKDTADEQ